MSNTTSNEREAVLTFEDKKYDLKSMPKEVQELVKGMQVADAQLRMHEDTLKVLAVGRQHLAMQLKAKLEPINPINLYPKPSFSLSMDFKRLYVSLRLKGKFILIL